MEKNLIKKLLYACEKAIAENPTLGFPDLMVAARFYLAQILQYPQLHLGPIQPPKQGS